MLCHFRLDYNQIMGPLDVLRCWLLIAVVSIGGTASAFQAQDAEFFEKRVRPVLVTRCLSCHGAQQQEGGLRLDSRDAILQGGDGGVVVVAGLPAESRLVQAVRREGDLAMPPKAALPPHEVAVIERWVAAGLPWPAGPESAGPALLGQTHWAFQPVALPPVPDVRAAETASGPMDRFLLQALEAKQLGFSRPASRATLARRFSFDLRGLPPTVEELAQFQADPAPDAAARLVDRFLASPDYGQRWGRHWLDVARYADNKGYVFFEEKTFPWAYTYRDYVIAAMNADLPFDRFIIEQLAADQLDLGSDQQPLAAMGFLTIGQHFMNNTHDIVDDRIDVVTRGLLGITVTCARCHDHKYDPIPQTDYYSLYGVFRGSHEPPVPPVFGPPPATEEYARFDAEMKERERKLVDFVTGKYRELVDGARTRVAEYLLAAHERRGQPPADDFMLLTDKGSVNPAMILRWQLHLEEVGREHPVWKPWVALQDLTASEWQAGRAEELLSQWQRSDGSHPVNSRVLRALTPAPRSLAETARRYGELFREIDAAWRKSRDVAPFASGEATAAAAEPASGTSAETRSSLADTADEEVRQQIYGPDTPADVPVQMDWGFLTLFPDRPTQAEYQALLKAVEEWSMKGAGAPPRAMVLRDSAAPYRARVFLRGNPNRLGDVVPRRLPALIEPQGRLLERGSGRKELAEAIASPTNPLTARVIVNRLWLHHFGRGLVETPSDFGLRSDPPTHPRLLDYLASELVRRDWSLKELHRALLLSTAYMQTSDDSEDGRRIDPENVLLWRMNRRRLDFESMRDSLLAVSDHLDRRIGGAPVDIFAPTASRRTVYGFIDRMDVAPLLTTFDFPNPSGSSAQRSATTVAPQALHLMNGDFAQETAARLSRRFASIAPPAERMRQLSLHVLSREPTADEQTAAQAFLGDQPTEERWTLLAHALLLTNEFLFAD